MLLINRIMETIGITQSFLSENSNLHQSRLSLILNGKAWPNQQEQQEQKEQKELYDFFRLSHEILLGKLEENHKCF